MNMLATLIETLDAPAHEDLQTERREIAIYRWQLEAEARAAQAMHDHHMGRQYTTTITNSDRLSYLTRHIGIDWARLDAAIQADRAALTTRNT